MSAPGWAVIGRSRWPLWIAAFLAVAIGVRRPLGTPAERFDIAVVHLLTSSTIDRLRELYPPGRLRGSPVPPNIVVSTGSEDPGFVENNWMPYGRHRRHRSPGHRRTMPRCVMITLSQADLPKDSGILRTAAQHNAVNVGVYASVVNGGTIRRGDAVVFA